jgi:hypothetical protein
MLEGFGSHFESAFHQDAGKRLGARVCPSLVSQNLTKPDTVLPWEPACLTEYQLF